MWDLLRGGHANPRIMELVRKYIIPEFTGLSLEKSRGEFFQLQRSGHLDSAMLYRDHASLSGVDERRENQFASLARGRDIAISHAALDQTEALLQQALNEHSLGKEVLNEIKWVLLGIQDCRRKIRSTDELLLPPDGRTTHSGGRD